MVGLFMKYLLSVMLGLGLVGSIWAAAPKEITLESVAPVVIKTTPTAGEKDVDPALSEISVVFSKDMQSGCMWSICAISNKTFPKLGTNIRYLDDKRTCVIPVTLEPGKVYALWFNHGQYNNFMDEQGNPSLPYLLVFKTRSR